MRSPLRTGLALGLMLFTASATPSIAGLPVVDPQAHGIHAEDLEALRAALRQSVGDEKGKLPGASLILVHRGEIIFREAFGNLTVDQSVPIASSTKPVTATGILMLADRGKLKLEDPLAQYIPEFADVRLKNGQKPRKPPTIGMALSNASGIMVTFTPAMLNPRQTLAESVRLTAQEPLLAEPGTAWNYSGTAFGVAARVGEIAAGMPFDRFLERELFAPLGMTHTHFPPVAPGFRLRHDPEKEGRFFLAAGSLFSTLDDYAVFLEMHRRGGTLGDVTILSESAVRAMQTKHNTVTGFMALLSQDYGYGWFLTRPNDAGRPRSFTHPGVFGSYPWVDQDLELSGVFLSVSKDQRAIRQAHAQILPRARALVPQDAKRRP